MTFRDYESRRDQQRRLGEQSAKQGMVTVRAVQKCDQGRRVDIALSPCGHRRDRRSTGWNVDLHSPPNRRISSTDSGPQPEAPRGPTDGHTQPPKSPKLAPAFWPDDTRADRG